MVKRMSETEIQRQVLEFIRKKYGRRAFVRKLPVGAMTVGNGGAARNPLTGMPDLVVILGGRFIGIEAKVPGGRVSPLQAITHGAIKEAGGLVLIVHSLEEAMTAMEGMR